MNLIKTGKISFLGSKCSNALIITCTTFNRWLKEVIPEKSFTKYDMLSFNLILPRERNFVIAGPAIGSPAAIMLLERLVVNNMKNIIVFGTCGSICKSINIGDVIVPTSAISEEGTSRLYSSTPKYRPSLYLLKHIRECFHKEGISFSEGKIWTTDAPCTETTEKVAFYRKKGAVGVDMELSALFSVCNLKKINVAGVLIVSDELHSDVWKTGFKSKILKNMYKQVFNTIITAFDEINKDINGKRL